jgi:hypothetical protein
MKTKKLALIGFFVSLFLFNSVLALPCAFFGEVKLDGSPTSGTNVEAYYLNGTFISKGKEPPAGFGHYSIAVNAPGENITLKIKGIPVDQGNQFCENGEPNYLNISATTPLTTSTISPSTTTTTHSGNGGGNGGGGGGGVTTTTIQTTTTVSTTEEKVKAMPNGETTAETTIPTTTVTTTVPQTSGITGAFLAGITSLGYWLIPIMILVILLIIFIIKKNTNTKKISSSEKTEISEETTSTTQSTINSFTVPHQETDNNS